jgi:oligosaccharide repeat unit polymerase
VASYTVVSLSGRLEIELLPAVLLWFLAALSCFPFSWTVFRGERIDVFEPIYAFSLTYFISFVIGTLFIVWEGHTMRTGISYHSELGDALFIACIGLVGGYVGYFWGKRGLVRSVFARSRSWLESLRCLDNKLVFRLSVVFLIGTVVLFYFWLLVSNVPLSYLNALNEEIGYGYATRLATSNLIFLFALPRTWPLLILLGFLYAPDRVSKRIMIAAWMANALFVAMSTVREAILFLLVSTIVVYYLQKETRPSLFAVLLISVTIISVVGLFVILRGAEEVSSISQVLEQVALEVSERGPLTGLMNVTYVFPERVWFLGFSAIRDIFITPIPRVVWPGKPSIHIVQDVTTRYMLEYKAHAPGLLGIFYGGFGVLGCFAIMFVYGVIGSLVYGFMRHGSQVNLSSLILAGWLPLVLTITWRGLMSKFLMEIVYRFGLVLFVAFLAVRMSSGSGRRSLKEE